jgi:uncharacterized membrane protein
MYPGSQSTTVTSIDDRNVMVGYYFNAGSGTSHGFQLSGLSYTPIEPPGDVGSIVNGISARTGVVVGVGIDSDGTGTNFSETLGTYQNITISGYPTAQVFGISPTTGELVGFYSLAPPIYAGFAYVDNTFQEILPPLTGGVVVASGVTDSGVVVGSFVDSSGFQHGFLWTPPAEARKEP